MYIIFISLYIYIYIYIYKYIYTYILYIYDTYVEIDDDLQLNVNIMNVLVPKHMLRLSWWHSYWTVPIYFMVLFFLKCNPVEPICNVMCTAF